MSAGTYPAGQRVRMGFTIFCVLDVILNDLVIVWSTAPEYSGAEDLMFTTVVRVAIIIGCVLLVHFGGKPGHWIAGIYALLYGLFLLMGAFFVSGLRMHDGAVITMVISFLWGAIALAVGAAVLANRDGSDALEPRGSRAKAMAQFKAHQRQLEAEGEAKVGAPCRPANLPPPRNIGPAADASAEGT